MIRPGAALRGVRPLHAARLGAALLHGRGDERPVFVVGVPRSGTTTVAAILAESPELSAVREESHPIWHLYHHPRRAGWRSGEVGAGEVGPGERRAVRAYFHARHGSARFADKCPANSLRIPHLLDLYPQATIVVCRRNPPDVVNSLLKGWLRTDRRFLSYRLPADPGLVDNPHPGWWRFALPPGWDELSGRGVADAALLTWDALSASIERARADVAPERWADVYLERLAEDPGAVAEALARATGVDPAPLRAAARRFAADPQNALSPGGAGKWAKENPEAIGERLSEIARVAAGRGYRVEPASGEFEIAASTSSDIASAGAG